MIEKDGWEMFEETDYYTSFWEFRHLCSDGKSRTYTPVIRRCERCKVNMPDSVWNFFYKVRQFVAPPNPPLNVRPGQVIEYYPKSMADKIGPLK